MADLDNMLGESFYAHNPMKYSMEKTSSRIVLPGIICHLELH